MDGTSYDIEALTFATAREAFDYCDVEQEGLGGDAVAIQHGSQILAIARKDAAWLEERGERLVYLRKVPLMRGGGDVVYGFVGAGSTESVAKSSGFMRRATEGSGPIRPSVPQPAERPPPEAR